MKHEKETKMFVFLLYIFARHTLDKVYCLVNVSNVFLNVLRN